MLEKAILYFGANLRGLQKLLLVALSLYSIWIVLIEISHIDSEWIIDDDQNLAYVHVSEIQDNIKEEYEDKLKFRIMPGYFIMVVKLIAYLILVSGLIIKSSEKLGVFSFIITAYDLVMKTSFYLTSIYYMAQELENAEILRFGLDTFAWLVIQSSYVIFIFNHIQGLVINDIQAEYRQKFPKLANYKQIMANLESYKQSQASARAPKETFTQIEKKSKIPVKSRNLVERWMELWQTQLMIEEQEKQAKLDELAMVAYDKNVPMPSKIPKLVRHHQITVAKMGAPASSSAPFIPIVPVDSREAKIKRHALCFDDEHGGLKTKSAMSCVIPPRRYRDYEDTAHTTTKEVTFSDEVTIATPVVMTRIRSGRTY